MSKNFWPDNAISFIEQIGIEHPIIQAPMAGGPSTSELVAAVSNSGSLGFLGVGYLTPEQIDLEIRRVRELTSKPFGVNLFIPGSITSTAISPKVLSRIERYSLELGIDSPELPGSPKYSFEDQLSVIIDNKVSVFSFTFGVPDKGLIDDLLRRGMSIIGTATCVEEGALLEAAGCSAIVAQGSEAGGHRGTFSSTDGIPMIGGLALVPQIVDAVQIPVIASGGVMDGRGIAASLALGASGVQMGTAFLSCQEARVPTPWLNSLLGSKDVSTVLSKAFSGKFARGIKNRFIEDMLPLENEIPNYPVQNSLTRPIRNAAKEKGDSDFMSLWAGQGAQMSRQSTAQELVDTLVLETSKALHRISTKL